MKKIIHLPLFLSLAGFVLLLISMKFDWIEGFSVIPFVVSLIGLLTVGISFVLLDKAKGFLKIAGIVCSISGFLIWTIAVYQIIELKSFWNIGLGLLSLGMIVAIYSVLHFQSPFWKKFAMITTLLILVVVAGTFLKLEKSILFGLETILLLIFSIISLCASVIKKTE